MVFRLKVYCKSATSGPKGLVGKAELAEKVNLQKTCLGKNVDLWTVYMDLQFILCDISANLLTNF